MIGFGELCRYKARAQEKRDDGLPWRWYTGVWLGIDPRTGQYIFFDTSFGTVRYARTMMRLPNVQKWSSEKVSAVCVTPWASYAGREPEV